MAAQKARGDNPRAVSFSSLTCPNAGPCTLEIRCPKSLFHGEKVGQILFCCRTCGLRRPPRAAELDAVRVRLPAWRGAQRCMQQIARRSPCGRAGVFIRRASSSTARDGGYGPPHKKNQSQTPSLFSVEKTLDSLSAEFSQAAGHIMDQPSRAGVSFCPFPGRQHQCWLHGSHTSSIRAG